MLGSYTRVFTVHDNTKNGCLGDKEVGVGGGRGALIQIPFMALREWVDIFL